MAHTIKLRFIGSVRELSGQTSYIYNGSGMMFTTTSLSRNKLKALLSSIFIMHQYTGPVGLTEKESISHYQHFILRILFC